MLSPRGPRARGAVAVLAAVALAVGCGESVPASAPAISAAAQAATEPAAFDRLAVYEWPAAPAPAAAPLVLAESAPPTVAADADPVEGDPRGIEAMALIPYPWHQRLTGWSIAFLPARAGLRGLTKADERRIEIYVRDSDSPASLARVVAHELGHAVDIELNSPSDRARWRAVRGVAPSVSWWPADAVSDFETLAGDFAEAFATLLTGSRSLSRVAPPPDAAALEVLAELVTR